MRNCAFERYVFALPSQFTQIVLPQNPPQLLQHPFFLRQNINESFSHLSPILSNFLLWDPGIFIMKEEVGANQWMIAWTAPTPFGAESH